MTDSATTSPDTLRTLAADQRVSLDPSARQFRIDANVALVGAEWVPIASASTVDLARSWVDDPRLEPHGREEGRS